jgi:hypothetical protein
VFVTLLRVNNAEVTVDFQTADDSATADSDCEERVARKERSEIREIIPRLPLRSSGLHAGLRTPRARQQLLGPEILPRQPTPF